MSTHSEIVTMIEDCEQRSSKLTNWELEFIDSISKQVGDGNGLSQKQDETLERIWDRVTS